MRDQLAVQSLQLRHTRELLKNLQDEVQEKDTAHQKALTAMNKELEDGIRLAGICLTTTKSTEKNVSDLNDKVHHLVDKLNEETQSRDVAVQDMQFKMEYQNQVLSHETNKLAEEIDARLKIVQDTDERFLLDLNSLQKKSEDITDLVNARHEEALQQLAEERVNTLQAISHGNSETLEQAHKEMEPQLNTLNMAVSALETRIIKFSTLSNDTSNRWLSSHDQLQEQYNSISQTVEQCRLQARTTGVSMQEIKDKLGVHMETVQSDGAAMKAQQYRERRAFEEQLRTMQQSLDGTLKSAITELESKVFSRVDREAAARTASIAKVLDDTGEVLEKRKPASSLRSKDSMSATIEIDTSAPEETMPSGKSIELKSAKGFTTPRQNTPITSVHQFTGSPVGYQTMGPPITPRMASTAGRSQPVVAPYGTSNPYGIVQQAPLLQGSSVSSLPRQGSVMRGSKSVNSLMAA
jgi:hypothetical protein